LLRAAWQLWPKGFSGLPIPFFIFGLYFTLKREPKKMIHEIPWGKGLPLYLVIAAPWFVYETFTHGNAFLYQVFYFYTFKRVVSSILNQAGGWYYYFPVLLLGFLPWSGFLPALGFKAWHGRKDEKVFFLGFWAVVTFIFFSFVHTKLPNYIFFLYPPLALLLAYFWESFSKKELISGSLLSLLFVGLLVTAVHMFAQKKLLPQEIVGNLNQVTPVLDILMVGCLISFLTALFKQRALVFSGLALTMSVFWLVLHFNYTGIVESYKPMKPLAETLATYRTKTPAPVLAYHVPGTASLIFYSNAPINNVNDPDAFLTLWKTEKYYGFLEEKTLVALGNRLKPYRLIDHKRTLYLIANFR